MTRTYPLNYRENEVSQIVGALDSGYSVSVIGPPSVGKSNLLKYLDQDQAFDNPDDSPWRKYAPKRIHMGRIVAVPVDPNALLPALPLKEGEVAARSWPGFELLIHRMAIMERLAPMPLQRAMPPEQEAHLKRLRERFHSIHGELTDFEDALHGHMALRHLESMIETVLEAFQVQDSPIRVAFILDEFERLLDTMPNYFFIALRSLRDRFKSRLMFVTFTRDNLQRLVEEQNRKTDLEPFIELFNDHTIYIGPFNDDDAWNMIANLERRSDQRNDYAVGLLIRATGGFAGLLRAGFRHAEKLENISNQDKQRVGHAATRLVAEMNVQAECETLLGNLNQREIDTLYAVVQRKTDLDALVLRELVAKSLLSENTPGGVVKVVPPVLAAYIRNHPTPPTARPRVRPFSIPT